MPSSFNSVVSFAMQSITVSSANHLLCVSHFVDNRPVIYFASDCGWLALCIKEHTHTHPFNGPFSGTTQLSRYQKGKTSLDFSEARDSEWQWHQLCHMQVCTLLQTDNHASTPPLCFLQAGCPSCCPTNSVKALKALKKFAVIWDYQQLKFYLLQIAIS